MFKQTNGTSQHYEERKGITSHNKNSPILYNQCPLDTVQMYELMNCERAN